ncbi:secreted protein [Beggiatoa sp. PS]|nr:secreted protein [Beggiatoa sp. PS]
MFFDIKGDNMQNKNTHSIVLLTLTIIVFVSNFVYAQDSDYKQKLYESLDATKTQVVESPDNGCANANKPDSATGWIVVTGKWKIDGQSVTYLGPDNPKSSQPYGIILNKGLIWNGSIETTVKFTKEVGTAHILFSYNPVTKGYYTSGLGGTGGYNQNLAYLVGEFSQTWYYNISGQQRRQGWMALGSFGSQSDLLLNVDYKLTTSIDDGRYGDLNVNNIKVIQRGLLPRSMYGPYVGLFAWGTGPIEFKDFRLNAKDLLNQN